MDPMGNSINKTRCFQESFEGGVFFLSQTSRLEAIVIYEATLRIMGSQVPGGLEIPELCFLQGQSPSIGGWHDS